MDEALTDALAENNISPRRTQVGWDVVCRHGDPTNVHALVRVSAQDASSVVLMLSHKDLEESEGSGGKIQNGATIRGILALRHVLFSNCTGETSMRPDLRVTVQLSAASTYVESAVFHSPRGEPLVQARASASLLARARARCHALQPALLLLVSVGASLPSL